MGHKSTKARSSEVIPEVPDKKLMDNFLRSLPTLVVNYVITFFDHRTLFNLMLTCEWLHKCATDEKVWRELFLRVYGMEHKPDKYASWRVAYKDYEYHILTFEDFSENYELLRVISKGNNDTTLQVRHKKSNGLFILVKFQHVPIWDSTFLQKIHWNTTRIYQHPFLVEYRNFFVSDAKCYYLRDGSGLLLFSLLNKYKQFKEDVVQFYAAQVLLAAEFLHSLGERNDWAYFGKAEQYEIGPDIYLQIPWLSDATLNVHLVTNFPCIATPEYLPPELCEHSEGARDKTKGLSTLAWVLGIFMHECATGLPPFYHYEYNQVVNNILTQDLNFEESTMSPKLQDLITMLLKKKPEERVTDITKIKEHPFFDGMDWNALYHKKIAPPAEFHPCEHISGCNCCNIVFEPEPEERNYKANSAIILSACCFSSGLIITLFVNVILLKSTSLHVGGEGGVFLGLLRKPLNVIFLKSNFLEDVLA
eukprot:Phypoly_transcript_07911.p1 GENE.Phypoly_transcript_07911~~Phypoly_transcript_07911.p1  ORF type:complete len:477 (+),score=54.42 Phypoly_transcript_07911:22-1452(+)